MSEAKQIEMVYEIISNAKRMIALVYKPDKELFADPKHIKDEKIREFYYEMNSMCVELADRNIMLWQKEDQNG